jgi:hypothetical protein
MKKASKGTLDKRRAEALAARPDRTAWLNAPWPELHCIFCEGIIDQSLDCTQCKAVHYHNADPCVVLMQEYLFVELGVGTYAIQGSRTKCSVFMGHNERFVRGTSRVKIVNIDVRLFRGADQALMDKLWESDNFDKLTFIKPLM